MAFGIQPHSLKKRISGYYSRRNFTLLNWLVTALVLTGHAYAGNGEPAKEKPVYPMEMKSDVTKQDSLPVRLPMAPLPAPRRVFEEMRELNRIKYDRIGSSGTAITSVRSTFTHEFKSRKLRKQLKELMNLKAQGRLFIYINNEGELLADQTYTKDERVEALFTYLNKVMPDLQLAAGDEVTLIESGKKTKLVVTSLRNKYKNFPGFENYTRKTHEFIAALMENELVSSTGEVKLEWRKKSSLQNGETVDRQAHTELSRLVEHYFSAKRITVTLKDGRMCTLSVDV